MPSSLRRPAASASGLGTRNWRAPNPLQESDSDTTGWPDVSCIANSSVSGSSANDEKTSSTSVPSAVASPRRARARSCPDREPRGSIAGRAETRWFAFSCWTYSTGAGLERAGNARCPNIGVPDHRDTASSTASVLFPSFGRPAMIPLAPFGQTFSTAQDGSASGVSTNDASDASIGSNCRHASEFLFGRERRIRILLEFLDRDGRVVDSAAKGRKCACQRIVFGGSHWRILPRGSSGLRVSVPTS